MATDSGQQEPVITVDGVEPSIEVRYIGNATREDGNEIINLYPDDNGAPRSLVLGGDPVKVTETELRQLEASFQIERPNDDGSWPSEQSETPGSPTSAQDQAAAASAGVAGNVGSPGSPTTPNPPGSSPQSGLAPSTSTPDTPGQ